MSKNIYVVWGTPHHNSKWLSDLDIKVCNRPEDADLVLFTGGEDIDPSFYNETPNPHTYTNPQRDNFELMHYKYFKNKEIPMIGICRGGQLLTAMAGGKLVQDSTHPGSHKMHTYDNKIITINSLHHQQFLIDEKITGLKEGEDYKMIGYAKCLSPYHCDGDDVDYEFAKTRVDYREPEITVYPKINALAIQWHPELMSIGSEAVQYMIGVTDNFLSNKYFK